MKKHFASLLFLLLAFTIVTSCKKDDEPKQPSKTEILSAKPWQLEGIYVFNTKITDFSQFGLPEGLDFSNSNVKFNTDGTYVATDRTTNNTDTGKWEFDSATDPKKITLDKGTEDEITLDIRTFTDKNLDLFTSQQIQGFPVTIDIKLIPA